MTLSHQLETMDFKSIVVHYRFTLFFKRILRDLPSLVMKRMERFNKLRRRGEDLDWIEKIPTKQFKL